MRKHCGNGEETDEYLLLFWPKQQQKTKVILVTRLTSQMCSETVSTRWNSSSLQGICLPHTVAAQWTLQSCRLTCGLLYFTSLRVMPLLLVRNKL